MHDSDQHIEKYERNMSFYDTIDSEFADWKITAIFYATLHYVNAYLHDAHSAGEFDLSSHNNTDNFIRCVGENELLKEYDTLKDLSRSARYGFSNMEPRVIAANKKLVNIINICKKNSAS